MTYKTPMKATDPCELERRIMDGSIAKNEAEWWAQHEIERLRGELEEAKRPYFQEMREMLRAMQAG